MATRIRSSLIPWRRADGMIARMTTSTHAPILLHGKGAVKGPAYAAREDPWRAPPGRSNVTPRSRRLTHPSWPTTT